MVDEENLDEELKKMFGLFKEINENECGEFIPIEDLKINFCLTIQDKISKYDESDFIDEEKEARADLFRKEENREHEIAVAESHNLSL